MSACKEQGRYKKVQSAESPFPAKRWEFVAAGQFPTSLIIQNIYTAVKLFTVI